MSEDTHTPGPWQANGSIIQAQGTVDTYEGVVWGIVAVCERLQDTDGEGRVWSAPGSIDANARLIAAAPDMLATLRDVLGVYTAPTYNDHRICLGCGAVLTMWEQHSENCTIGRVQAVLAKAEGKGDTE